MKKTIVLDTTTGKPTGKIRFTFDSTAADIVFDCQRMSVANQQYALPFAMMHRLGDAAALSTTDKDGKPVKVTESMRAAEVQALVDHYYSGSDQWSPKTKRVTVTENATIAAIAAKKGMTYQEAEAFLANMLLGEI